MNYQQTTLVIILILLMVVSIYLAFKFLLNFHRSAKKTKQILGRELIMPYVQGMKWASSAFFNIIMIDIIIGILLILSSLGFGKVYSTLKWANNYTAFYFAVMLLTLITALAFNLGIVIIYFVSFNYPQYKTKKSELPEEFKSLKQIVSIETSEIPETIKIDADKMQARNILATKVISKFLHFYSILDTLPLIKKYKIYLDQIFKINFFADTLLFMEQQKQKEEEILSYVEAQQNIKKQAANQDELDKDAKVKEEINWMEEMAENVNNKAVAENLKNTISAKEYNKKYDEYYQAVRSQDPMYASVNKNNWLTYRDADVQDLFYNTQSTVYYSIDDGKTIIEKPLNEFLLEYKKFLVAKFYK
ncbi:hypothetical protein [Metamycoplasma hyosynoviae]|uniref:hypothetical protein n=1 Tax=Metamycoplasma hyosynoviae TaxID=29559 RepID=UPI002358D2A6|nr:hypothetical protein [Metamycoplasma hyosynoviae]MDC8919547.1 hypothetical protein [Metamycoplasma hyosynoviae]MDD1371974.1 hypothetical protein [Metamycoplasma hyosynoviae]MDD7847321.1 hypothetical protein [Metamycoplasma hyosynoviae]MDI3064044.1 hypothetical protein [Metamycoplasma hyosynoviae]